MYVSITRFPFGDDATGRNGMGRNQAAQNDAHVGKQNVHEWGWGWGIGGLPFRCFRWNDCLFSARLLSGEDELSQNSSHLHMMLTGIVFRLWGSFAHTGVLNNTKVRGMGGGGGAMKRNTVFFLCSVYLSVLRGISCIVRPRL
jgi:hypothetical protein